jgi:hypothetical protein
MHREARRLVHDDELGILVHDLHADGLRRELLDRRQLDDHHRPRVEPVALRAWLSVDRDRAVLDEALRQ